MLKLNENEMVLIILRRHWWVLLGPGTLAAALLAVPPLLLTLLPGFFPDWPWGTFGIFSGVLFFAYLLSLLLFAFVVWTNYYLDVWIITNRRIIDIEQASLFDRRISEFSMDRVQDVSIQISGIVETVLKFGSIKVDTAGHNPFIIDDVPHLYEAKDAILRFSSRAN